MKTNPKIPLLLSSIFGLMSLYYFTTEQSASAGIWLVGFFLFLALGFRGIPLLKGMSFTVLIFAAVSVSMFFPAPFIEFGGVQMKVLIVPLLQIIMFGMGTAMSLRDFYGVIKMPKGVLVGLLCQFSIMPLVGFSLATLFQFPPEIAAGVVLIGSSPSGLASNVMAYLANANVALSVTLTAVATVIAPFMTPLLMEFFAGAFVPIDFWVMMLSIVKIVILPITLGLIFNHFFHKKTPWLDKIMPLISMAAIVMIITIITAAGRDNLLTIGGFLILASIIHNFLGYFFGYWGCRILKLREQDCRTIALEVGMQNGGLASGIALEMGKVATVGLAPAVFGPWMNISGSSLASWWRNKKIEP
ncbi:MAG: Pantothenate precursors transporter PanS [Flavobacteriaceae bacterium]|nr:MAG: Pantothenate precursors transporter PanS [Flavobacteriaceae bacterium]